MQVELGKHFVDVRVKHSEIVQDVVESLGLDRFKKVVVATIEPGIVLRKAGLPILPPARKRRHRRPIGPEDCR
ncbi:unnamed protein product [Sphagnum balticum]